MKKDWHVYIVKCSDSTLYTGTTNDLNKRIEKHNNGTGAKYTRGRGPVKLMASWSNMTKSEACKYESKVKKLSKEQKLKLITESNEP